MMAAITTAISMTAPFIIRWCYFEFYQRDFTKFSVPSETLSLKDGSCNVPLMASAMSVRTEVNTAK